MSTLHDALTYADRGWQVFPLQPRDKIPLERSRGFKDATTNPALLRRWFGNQAGFNIGIRTGVISGILVIDVDGSNGAFSLRELEEKYGPLPRTLVSVTGRGSHLWLAIDKPVDSSASRIGNCIDVQADDRYVVVPPSTHPDGSAYRWIDETTPPAPAPDWLLNLAKKKTISERALSYIPRPSGSVIDAYGRKALDAEIADLVAVPPGARNHALNKTAFRLYQLVAGGELEAADVEQQLIEAAKANGLWSDRDDGPDSVIKTIRSGQRAGLQHPRSRGVR